jgi:Tfp pilus assembly protein PilF
MSRRKKKNAISVELPSRRMPRRRRWWLLGVLGLLLVVIFVQRERFAAAIADYGLSQATEFDHQPTERYLNLAAKISRQSPEIELVRARLARRIGDFGTANKHLDQARLHSAEPARIELEQWLITAQSGQSTNADRKFAELLEQSVGHEDEVCLAYVLGYLRDRKFEEAMILLDGWIQDFPDDPRPFAWLGQVLTELQRTEEAETAFREALQRQLDHPAAALGLASLLVNDRRLDEALPFFRIAASNRFDGTAAGFAGWALCLRSAGNTAGAKTVLEQAVQQYPSEPDLLVELANLAIESGQHQQAVELLAGEIDKGSKRQDSNFVYATALRGVGKVDQASTYFKLAAEAARETTEASQLTAEVALRPNDLELRYQIGSKHLRYGNTKDGLLWLQGVLAANPNHSASHAALAEYYQSRIDDDAQSAEKAKRHREMADRKQ